MAASWLFVALKLTDRDSTYVKNKLRTNGQASARGEKRRVVDGIKELLTGAVGGTHGANLFVGVTADSGSSGAYPVFNVACVQSTSAGSAVTFTWGGHVVTLTEGIDFARGASNTTEAAALAAAINANEILKGLYSAVGNVGNCVITGKIPGSLLADVAIAGGTGFTVTTTTAGAEFTSALRLQNVLLGRTP